MTKAPLLPPLLDTHIWIWWMLGDTRLSARERTVLDDLPSGQRPRLCDISLWEVAMLVQLGAASARRCPRGLVAHRRFAGHPPIAAGVALGGVVAKRPYPIG
jgi:hypothetical protein